MRFNPDKHHRRSIRLKDYDYRQEGAYFITVCTQGRLCLFGDISDNKLDPNQPGKMVMQALEDLAVKYPGVFVDTFVLMPNHIHGVIVLSRNDVGMGPRAHPPISSFETRNVTPPDKGQARGPVPTDDDEGQLSLPDVVHRYKSWTTKLYSDGVKQQGWEPFPGRLWQQNYYERIIRNDDELNRIREYINGNPQNWALDEENPANITANKALAGTR